MLVLSLDQFNCQNIFFGNPLKNNIINNGSFYHINYSTHYFSLNTIYIDIPLKVNCISNKKFYFKKNDNEVLIKKIKNIEYDMLATRSKEKHYKISQFLDNENIIIPEYSDNFKILLKISGLWETEFFCGLSFKFIIHPLKNETILLNSKI